MKIVFIVMVTLSLACLSKNEKTITDIHSEIKNTDSFRVRKQDDSVPKVILTPLLSFLDSISRKYTLSVKQIQRHTNIDTAYYTGVFSGAVFTGDTIFHFHPNFKGVILSYDDKKSCIYKFILILDSTASRNLDYKLIYADCDHDESADYTNLRYRLLNDSIFETIETFISANSERKAIDNRKQTQKWKLSQDGIINL